MPSSIYESTASSVVTLSAPVPGIIVTVASTYFAAATSWNTCNTTAFAKVWGRADLIV